MTDGERRGLARTAGARSTHEGFFLIIRHPSLWKRDLARIYTPHTRQAKSAMKKLREDINRCPELVEALQQQTRWNRNRNYYTARQVRLIAEYLCID